MPRTLDRPNRAATLADLLESRRRRRALLWAEARRLGDLFRQRGAEAVWVFGSLAHGRATVSSDLDLAVVWDTDLPPLQRAIRLLADSQPAVAVDLLVFTPGEFARLPSRRWLEGAVRVA